MGESQDADAARKERIVNHMNKDHTRELSHILQHYNGLKRSYTVNPALKDISLESMQIRAGGLNHNVPFTPALTSWDQIRERLVTMDTTSRAALKISDIYVTEYHAPRGFDWVVGGGVAFFFCNALALPWLQPGTTFWQVVDTLWPLGAPQYAWLVKAMVIPVLIIHVTECLLFDAYRMHRHSVPRWSGLYWKWQISIFMEGIGAWRRFGEMVKEKEEAKTAKKKQ